MGLHTIHTMNHPDIKFSSLNPNQVSFYEVHLKNTSLDDIKKNRIEGRHGLLLNMGLAGDCPLLDEYMSMREKIYKRCAARAEPYKKLSTYPFERDRIAIEVRKEIEEEFGWVIPG